MQEIIININNVSKTYRGNAAPAVSNFSIDVVQGEIFGLLGPNGAGKSTLLNILSGLLPFDTGKISICGRKLPQQLNEIKPLIGVVPQEIALYPSMTAVENLKVFGGFYGLRKKELNRRIDSLIAYFGLAQSKNRWIKTYSGGMKRRINLIAGLLHQPTILFLDEPTVSVDVQSKTLILDNLKEINAQGTTIIYTSHFMEEAEMLCSRVAFIDEGKLLCKGTPNDLIQDSGCENLEALYLKLTGKTLRD
ncbi:MAG: ABC transporter ATP-binding protein [Prevotellaceae bacterium]|jgi:ABC-2 type transport system ATP-binding protein|nr:ABC transporter ATP-binding protein [Prevotellaceae bacterium]